MGPAQARKEGYEKCLPQAGRWLGRFFLRIIDKLLVDFAFLNQFTFPPAYFDMYLRASLPLIASKVTHLSNPLFCPVGHNSICWI